ncbi:hypothetical protein RR42_s0428 [Cupriavidus basilensis]|uniref:Uncharacterized protein n=1 Tax=Cupriavidus basilensis TaxID=68895 RepID=A0A0C4YJE9_9BURK|nr:hypothetical protein RR42_s0428 [Cupriavidus basilensis]
MPLLLCACFVLRCASGGWRGATDAAMRQPPRRSLDRIVNAMKSSLWLFALGSVTPILKRGCACRRDRCACRLPACWRRRP